MFRALLAHPQEALHKLHLVYCGRVMSVVPHARNIPSAAWVAPHEDEHVMHNIGFIVLIYYDAQSTKY
jgi:hypothetical protein